MKSLTAFLYTISLMLSIWLGVMAQARVLPPPSLSSSKKAPLNSDSERLRPTASKQPAIAASLRRIPPSIPNPTQNKLKPRNMG
ncbi:hypothetical protein PanWU01x14_157800 [Parasponia andersonii]|uniref:Transmembrane protein n=1 Tax=Parasponia andersonii TaxID=3476 RepID=A0A2P5CF91_PARAD|nr:hypothetical protein PanWU01x14_157800 [Parasponia andersonii]